MDSVSAGSGPRSESAAFASACRTFRIPGITVDTAGWERQKRRAISGRLPAVAEILPQRVDVLHHLLLAVAAEIEVAELAVGKVVFS